MSTHITCSNFGWRLGNQLFQFATLFSYSSKKNKKILLLNASKNEHIFKCFNINLVEFADKIATSRSFKETKFSFNDSLFHNEYDNIIGYFQTEKYFSSYADVIKQILIFKEFGKNYNNKCFIHVRRGDYLKYPNVHPVCSEQYYSSSIDIIRQKYGSNVEFIVFSDDIAACKSYQCFKQNNISFEESTNAYHNLQSMTTCNCGIIANSSYSWWGAWLMNKVDSTIIAPKIWFSAKDPAPKDTCDIYCADWIINGA